jgi:HlyD family secretion protein
MAIPESLLQFEKDSAYVEVEVAPQQYEKRFIKTGLSDGINVEIKSGLTLEDKIKKPGSQLK